MKIKNLFLIIVVSGLVLSACDTYKPNITMVEAVKVGNEKAVKYYIKRGEMVNQKDETRTPLIILATQKGFVSIIKRLINVGVDVNAKSRRGSTALMFAPTSEIAKILIKAGADVNIKNNYGNTALMAASQNGYSDVVKILIEEGADVNAESRQGGNVLMTATLKGNTDIVDMLIKAKANVNYTDKYGKTALKIAKDKSYTEITKMLIEAGAKE